MFNPLQKNDFIAIFLEYEGLWVLQHAFTWAAYF